MNAVNPNLAQQPWLSILIPAHNPGEYLAEALASVLAQCDGGVEVLVFNDASTDGTADLLARTVARTTARGMPSDGQPSVRVIGSAKAAVGVSVARNALLEAAQGQWLWFLDADDRLRPQAVAQVRAVVQAQPQLQVVVVDHAVLRPRSTLKHRLRGEAHRRSMDGVGGAVLPTGTLMPRMLARGQWHVWGKVVRRDAWPAALRFPAQRVFEDLSVVPRLMAGMEHVWYLDTPLVEYRSNPSSILGSMSPAKLHDWARALEDLVDWPAFDRAWADFVIQQALRLLRVAQRLEHTQAVGDRAWLDTWWTALCDQQPALMQALAAWRWQPRRWAGWWRARQQGWTRVGVARANHSGAPH
jgi:glycosyltransferase involved in cell wall biosynthesis